MTRERFVVELSQGAQDDLQAIDAYIEDAHSGDAADRLLDALMTRASALETFPFRGSVPKELDELGVPDFRQIVHENYRMIYEIVENRVVVLVIADGRRDMSLLLQKRILDR